MLRPITFSNNSNRYSQLSLEFETRLLNVKNELKRVKNDLKREKEISNHGQISFILEEYDYRKALLIKKCGSPERKKEAIVRL